MRTKVDLKDRIRSQIMLAHREVWGRARDAGEYWGGGHTSGLEAATNYQPAQMDFQILAGRAALVQT